MPSASVKVILSSRKEVLKWQIHPVIGNPSLSEFFRLLATGQISPEVFINIDYQNFSDANNYKLFRKCTY